ncbi:unnamed protein product [Strongylus vulgaris]|uniref:Uncharacterized protein n=1 Tax=Strongylus vulgaris TaxID=40348 RepID=A0A3P7J7D7_STRVU|nr:unnamed protein product [Strongylus vulgaris]
MSFHPPVRPEVKPKPPKQWYEELLENVRMKFFYTSRLAWEFCFQDSAMSFHPPVRPEVKPKPPKQWYEELLENDEILLYFTASLGVLLPGLVYLIYHKVHKIYMNYAKKKGQERLAEEAARSEVAIVSLCTEDSVARRFLSHLENVLRAELVNPPKIWDAEKLKAKDFASFKVQLLK